MKFSELSTDRKLEEINKQMRRGNALQATQTVVTILVFIGIVSFADLFAKVKSKIA
jgi:hypothetical protein